MPISDRPRTSRVTSSGARKPHDFVRQISYQFVGTLPSLALRGPIGREENGGMCYYVTPSSAAPADGLCANTSCIDCWPVANELPIPSHIKLVAASVLMKQETSEGVFTRTFRFHTASTMAARGWTATPSRCALCLSSFTRQYNVHEDWNSLVPCPAEYTGEKACICQVCVAVHGLIWCPLEGAWRASNDTFHYEPLGVQISHYWAHENLYTSDSGHYYLTEEEAEEATRIERRASARARRGGNVYGYHDATPMDVHEIGGWPAATPKDSLCFGVELEMENRTEDDYDGQAELAAALGGLDGDDPKPNPDGGNYILMSDGSLSQSGVELITCPYTLDYHQKKFGWDAVLSTVKSIGKSGAGTSACGMHVHCNRKAISALTLGKMLVFVNGENNRALMARVAQRNSDRWARMYQKYIKQGRDEYSDKYEALHLSPKTIEFRIFRGNLRPQRVLKNIEFCHSVVSYCKIASMKELSGHSGYLAWLGQNRGTYPNLIKFLGETYGFKDTAKRKQSAELDI